MKLPVLAVAVLLPIVCFGVESTGGENGFVAQKSDVPQNLILENGVSVRLAARSAGAIYADHAVLQEGGLRVSHFGGYRVDAGQLSVESETPEAEAVIRFEEKTIEVASLRGAVRVSDGGATMTRVAAGTRMSFQNPASTPDAAARTPTGAAKGKQPISETKVLVWVIVGVSVAALAIGLTAVAQGKSL